MCGVSYKSGPVKTGPTRVVDTPLGPIAIMEGGICSKFQHIYVPQKTRNIYGQNFNVYNNIIDKKYIWAKFQHTQQTRNIMGYYYSILWANFNYSKDKNI